MCDTPQTTEQQATNALTGVFHFYDAEGNLIQSTPFTGTLTKESEHDGSDSQ